MKKRLSLLVMLMGLCLVATAQKQMEVSDMTEAGDMFSGEGSYAAVEIHGENGMSLSFESTMDKSVQVFRKELQGSDSVYYLLFDTGADYRGRVLTIRSNGFNQFNLALALTPKQLKTFKVYDPNILVDAGCYRSHRNKGKEEFKNMNYGEAKNQFALASQCTDVNESENAINMADADTCIMLRYKADAAYNVRDYGTATQLYNKILALNPYDTYASGRAQESSSRFTDECDASMSKGDYYFAAKDYERAIPFYNTVLNRNCFNKAIATEKLNQIEKNKESRKNHSHVVTYEFMKDVPIGLSTGTYNMKKWGAFFSINFNPKLFKAIRKNVVYKPGEEEKGSGVKGDYPELNMNFGWTRKIYAPVWIYFGPGVTMKMYYGKYEEKNYPLNEKHELDGHMYNDGKLEMSEDEKSDNYKAWHKANFAFAISPTVGLCVKYSYFALRVGYEYRFSVQKKLQDFMGAHRVTVGVGVAF